MSKVMPLSSTRYFSVVASLTLLILALLIWKDAETKQVMLEYFGLEDVLQAREDSFYQQRVNDIFVKYCVACHGEKKEKGGLRMDSFRHTVFGGKSGDMLIGGTTSLLFQRMSLPENSRLAMPPYGRDRQNKEELKVIQLWLEKGASGALLEKDFPEAPTKQKKITFGKLDLESIRVNRQPLAETVDILRNKYPSSLYYIARTSHYLELDTINLSSDFDDVAFSDFKPLSSALRRLNVAGTNLTDQSIPLISLMQGLEVIQIQNTRITSKGVSELDKLTNLKRLVVSEKAISDEIKKALVKQGVVVVAVAPQKGTAAPD